MNLTGKLANLFNNPSDRIATLAVVLIQTCLVCFVFDTIIFEGKQTVFNNSYDGIKNYFTLQGYVSEPPETEYLKFSLMNYPYGDYIFYTDNTPLFAVLEKALLHKPENALFYFNLFILSGILFSSIILFQLLRLLPVRSLLAVIISVGLPWLCPQILRMNAHFNLTLSCVLLLVIYLLAKRQRNPVIAYDFFLAVVILLSGFIHLYYLLISLVFVFSFVGIDTLQRIFSRESWFGNFFRGALICFFSLALFFVILRITDNYYELRRASAEGYDFDDWKLQFSALYTPYFFHPLNKLITGSFHYESFAYLGTGTLVGIAGIFFYVLAHLKNLKSDFSELKNSSAFRLFALLLLASLPGLLIALGENVHVAGDFYFTNYLNPFFYLRKIIPQVTHFRCLGRFSWYFFWCANVAVLLFIVALQSKKYFKVLLAVMLAGFLADVFYAVRYSASAYETTNPFSKESLAETKKAFGEIQPSGYQALLAFPFYHVGSEDYNYTIDPEDAHCIKTMQLSLASGLPLINSKMSRTALQHTYNIFSLFETTISDSLLHDLNDKPVLVYLDKTFYNNDTLLLQKTPVTERMPAKDVLLHGHEIIRKYEMKILLETDTYALYGWKPLN